MKAISPSFSWSNRGTDLTVTLILLLTGGCIYARTLWYPFISFDDPGYVAQNSHVNGGLTWAGWKWAWTSLELSNWHPLTWLSLMLDAQLYGLNAGGYHLTNLILHEVNGVLIFWWLRQATGARWPSALTAFFFVAHPLHVESVAWITERKDVLSTFFFCAVLLSYTRFAKGGERRFYWLAGGLFGLGLTAKPMLVTLPPLLLLLDYWPLQRLEKEGWKRLLLEKLPFVVLATASCVVTVIAQRANALVPLESLALSQRASAAAAGYGTYLVKTLWPLDLGVYYPYEHARSWLVPVGWALTLAMVTLAAVLARRSAPYLLVGWGWFLGTLVPVIGVVQVGGQAVADRYTYLPHVGLFIAVCWTGAAVWTRQGRAGRAALVALTTVAAIMAVALSCRQVGYWRDSAVLFERTVQVVRPTARLYTLLGNAQVEAKRPAKATEAYLRARRLGSTDDEILRPLGTLLLNAGRWSEAAEVLAPVRRRPTATANMLNNLALALVNSGRGEEALAVYQQCTERFPDFALARFGWAELLQARGQVADAAAQDEAGLSLRDDWLPALLRLAWNYAHSPDGPTREMGLALAQRAVSVSGQGNLNTLNVLAFAQAANGRWDEAVQTAAKAMEMAQVSGAAVGMVNGCRERLERYRRWQLPP